MHVTPEMLPERLEEFQLEGPTTVFVVMSNDEQAATEVWKTLVAESVPNVYILSGGVNGWLDTFAGDDARIWPVEASGPDGAALRLRRRPGLNLPGGRSGTRQVRARVSGQNQTRTQARPDRGRVRLDPCRPARAGRDRHRKRRWGEQRSPHRLFSVGSCCLAPGGRRLPLSRRGASRAASLRGGHPAKQRPAPGRGRRPAGAADGTARPRRQW